MRGPPCVKINFPNHFEPFPLSEGEDPKMGQPPPRYCLHVYWALEVAWAIAYVGCVIAIEAATHGADGLPHQTAIAVNALHFTMMAVVLYALDSKARKLIVLGFVAVLITDATAVLHDGLHLWHTTEQFYFAFILNMCISSFGLFISLYALSWFLWRLAERPKHERPRVRDGYDRL